MISIGSKKMVDCQVGSKKVKEIYKGSTKVWPTSLWSGTIDNSEALGQIATIPNLSGKTKITVTFQYVSGTWNTSSPGSYIQYLIRGQGNFTVDPPLSPQNPTVTFTSDVYYTNPYQAAHYKMFSLIGSDGTNTKSLKFTYNTHTGVISANFDKNEGDTITPPVKVTINATNP